MAYDSARRGAPRGNGGGGRRNQGSRDGGGGGSSRRGGPPQYYIKQTDPKAPDKRADDASWFIGSGWAVEGYDGINFVIDMRDVQITKGRDLDGNEIDVLRGTIWKRKPKQRD